MWLSRYLLPGFVLSSAVISAFFFLFVGSVKAEEITITNNGSSSTSDVTLSQNTQTTVQQQNTSTVTNDVKTDANTGNNTASQNTGGSTSIDTGSSTTNVSVSNEGNTSGVSANNCGCQNPTPSSITITGNGDNSQNTASVNTTTTMTVGVNNTATVTNHIVGTGDTGHNSASGNNGSVSITTGDITAGQQVVNKVNSVSVAITQGFADPISVKIAGNGANSRNYVELNNSQNNTTDISNKAQILNEISWALNTGGNSANSNNGNVDIKTGNIVFNSSILNDVNSDVVKITCCPSGVTPPPPPHDGGGGNNNGGGGGGSTPPPSNTSSGTSGVSAGSSTPSAGSVLGASTGQILPITGGGSWLLWAILGNIIMMFMGMYLRLRSGRSPATV